MSRKPSMLDSAHRTGHSRAVLSSSQSKHNIHRSISGQTVQLITLINGQNTALSRHELNNFVRQ